MMFCLAKMFTAAFNFSTSSAEVSKMTAEQTNNSFTAHMMVITDVVTEGYNVARNCNRNQLCYTDDLLSAIWQYIYQLHSIE